MAQQQWEAEQRLRVEVTKTLAHALTQLNAELRVMMYDVSEKDEFCQIGMQEFAVLAEEAMDVQKRSLAKKVGEELRPHERSTKALVSNVESKLQNQSLESSSPSSDFEAGKAELQRELS